MSASARARRPEPVEGSRPRVAAIDCGTNTIKLLIGTLPDVDVRTSRMVRLGQGVDKTGRLDDAALERAFAAVDEYAELIAAHDVDRVRFCATSATRDASNGEVFTAGVQQRLGVTPEVLSGDEEAALAFGGSVRAVEVPAPRLVIDIGGGSTELILGDKAPTSAYSMNIGAVRLTERCLSTDPHTDAEIAACREVIRAELDAQPVNPGAAAAVVGVAGTITTIAAGVLNLAAYDRELIHDNALAIAAVRAHCAELVTMTTEQRKQLPWMHPGRADVIGAGALILDEILARATVDAVTISEADILDGIAWSIVDA